MAKSRFAWGIDIGNRALKAVKVVRDGAGVRIDDFDVIEHEHILSNAGDNRQAIIQTALAIFSGRHSTKGGSLAIGVSGQQSFARFIKLPPVEDKKIPEIVRFEAIQQIPFPLDEVEWSYQLFRDEGSPEVEVGIFAMRKDLIQEHIQFFTDTGMNVQFVQMNPLADYNALYHDQRLKGTTMIVDIGAENADLIIAEGEQIWMRSIPIGGNNFTEALVKAFKLRFEKAEELKRNAATSKYGRQILQAMRPIFADLVSEIQRSIGFYSSVHRDSRISRVLALGGTFKLPGLQKYLQQNLTLDVVKLDRLGDVPPTDGKVAAALSENLLSSVSAYGLALQALGEAKITSSLLPQTIKREREWRQKTPVFAVAAAVIIAAVGIKAYRASSDRYKFEQNKDLQDQIQRDYQQAKLLSNQWNDISARGEMDRKAIADIHGLMRYRDLLAGIHQDVFSCVPSAPAALSTAPSTRPGATRPAASPNDKRVILEDFQPEYQADLTQLLAMDDGQFNRSIPPNPSLGNTLPATGGDATGGSGMNQPRRSGLPMDPRASMMPSRSFAAPTPGAEAVVPPRGFLITMHLVTPNANGVRLVDSTFVEAVRQKMRAASEAASKPTLGQPAPLYTIKRISIPYYIQFGKDPARVQQLKERYLSAQERKAAGEIEATYTPSLPGQQNGAMEQPGFHPRPGGASGYGARGGIMPTRPPGGGFSGLPGTGGRYVPRPPSQSSQEVDEAEFLVDPVTGEDVRNWWDVTVALVVVVDSNASPTSAGAAPSETPPAAPQPTRPPPMDASFEGNPSR